MPASSPSFPSSSDGRGKWRKRRREPQINRRLKQEDEEDDEDDAVPDENLDQQQDREDDSEDGVQPNPQSGSSAPDPSSSSSHESEVSPDGAVRCSDFPPVMRRILNRPHPSVMAIVALERANEFGESKVQGQGSSLMFLENVSHGQLQALSAVPPDCPGLDQDRSDGGNSAYVVTPPPIMEGRGVVKRFGSRSHVVPMHSDWFSPATVHRLERQVVPHFFSGKAPDHTPEKYMECRNYVVAKYMENPEKRFTVSDFVGVIAGLETEDLSRIVRFLDHWGIINYCAAASSHEPWNSNSYLTEESNGEIHVPSAALKSIDSLIKFDKPKCKLKAADVYSSLSSHDNNVSDLDNRIRERLSENHCNSCSRPLPTVYYQSHKEVDIMLCSDCFHDGRYVIGHSSLDFTRMDSTKDYGDLDGESWTDQETLFLLEAVEMYNENWNEIAEHVGTKSKAQCILHFLRLPVEDGLLENIEVPGNPISSNMSNGAVHGQISANANGDSAGSCQQDADFESRFPFANSGNPVMSLVAFLASSVGPRVAAACAHASLAALSEDRSLSASENQLQKEGPGQSNRMNSEIMHGRDSGPQGEIANSVHHKAVASRGQNEAGATPLSAEKVKAAAKAGLAAAATKAKLFADHEEREIQRLSANIINHQLKRLELKLKQFAEVETFLMKECEQVERTRQRLLAERSRFMAAQMGASGITSSMSLPAAPSPSMVNNTGNNRQQIMSAPPSQPSISGYNNNNQPQQVHPHMPFRPRQQMFGMGPRLPLAAIQSPSSAPPNVMYNASGNPQPSMNHPMLRPVSGTSSGLG